MTCSEAKFLKDVAQHQMTVLRDDGLYKHLRFKRPVDAHMHFDLVTWPGYLAYSGDMGCYVFNRQADMLEFVRAARGAKSGLGIADPLKFDPAYWGEKLQGIDKSDGYRTYSKAVFRQRVKDEYETACEYIESDERRAALWEALENDVLSKGDTEATAYQALVEFDHVDLKFSDVFEWNLRDYTSRYMWCCFAIAWGVKQYDLATAPASPVVSS